MKSFLQGKKTLAVTSLRAPAHPSSAHARGHDPRAPLSVVTPGASNAHVEVVKEGGKVVRLVVTCTCGERVEIECLYSAGS
ncbi:MAG TPA: hypothetical protein VHD62_15115 [Opitutaceae bacterium]|nr:hypothetical protein [Opitutaceae bacterium]